MHRKFVHLMGCLLMVTGTAFAAADSAATAPAAKTLLMLDFELIDEQLGSVPFPGKEERLRMVGERLRERFVAEGLYRVLDAAPIARDIGEVQARSSFLGCNGCELDLARKLGAQRVLLAWVQKVSNLILNLNIEIRDVESGRSVLNKSVDMRGNNDLSWQRAVDYMVRDMVERNQRNL